MEDKRSHRRAPIIAAVEVVEVATGTKLSARTSDISRAGCYVDTLNPTPSKTVVRVRIQHQGGEIDVQGRIVYVSPGLGMGIRFDDDLTPQQLAVLDRWVAEAG
jgi:hypothetical protein